MLQADPRGLHDWLYYFPRYFAHWSCILSLSGQQEQVEEEEKEGRREGAGVTLFSWVGSDGQLCHFGPIVQPHQNRQLFTERLLKLFSVQFFASAVKTWRAQLASSWRWNYYYYYYCTCLEEVYWHVKKRWIVPAHHQDYHVSQEAELTLTSLWLSQEVNVYLFSKFIVASRSRVYLLNNKSTSQAVKCDLLSKFYHWLSELIYH